MWDDLEEAYGFTADSEHFLLTMKTLLPDSTPTRSTTLLYAFGLTDGTVRTANLGPFWPTRLEMSPSWAMLRGRRQAESRLNRPIEEGYYGITLAPWSIEKHVERIVEPFTR